MMSPSFEYGQYAPMYTQDMTSGQFPGVGQYYAAAPFSPMQSQVQYAEFAPMIQQPIMQQSIIQQPIMQQPVMQRYQAPMVYEVCNLSEYANY